MRPVLPVLAGPERSFEGLPRHGGVPGAPWGWSDAPEQQASAAPPDQQSGPNFASKPRNQRDSLRGPRSNLPPAIKGRAPTGHLNGARNKGPEGPYKSQEGWLKDVPSRLEWLNDEGTDSDGFMRTSARSRLGTTHRPSCRQRDEGAAFACGNGQQLREQS